MQQMNQETQIHGNFVDIDLGDEEGTILLIPVGRMDFSNQPLRMLELLLCGEQWKKQHEERLRIWETAQDDQLFISNIR